MRYTLLCFSLLILRTAFSQDTLIFNNGDTVAVDLVTIDESKGLMVYIENTDSLIVASKIIKEYRIHSDVLYSLPDKVTAHSAESKSEYSAKHGFFSTPVEHEQGKFAITTNLTSLLKKSGGNNRLNFAVNHILTIEPEYYISGRLSIKIPVGIGLNQVKPDTYASYSGYNIYNDSYDSPDPPYFSTYYFSSYDYLDEHPRNVIFQVGIYTKHFSKIPKKNYFYFSQGLSFGMGNLYAVDYYHQYVYSEQDGYWVIAEGRKVVNNNIASYIRYELIGGLNWSISKFISFSFETGYSTSMGSNGNKEDHFYRRLNNDDFILMSTNLYSNSHEKGRFILRVNLIFRFNGKKIQTDSE